MQEALVRTLRHGPLGRLDHPKAYLRTTIYHLAVSAPAAAEPTEYMLELTVDDADFHADEVAGTAATLTNGAALRSLASRRLDRRLA